MKLGIEAEYWVIDDTGALSSTEGLVDAHEQVTGEFVEPLIEIQTRPTESERELREDFRTVLESVLAVANEQGKELVPLGTPLARESIPIVTERGRLLERLYGDELEYAKSCAGTHVHFDKGSVGSQLNLLTALDPALALVNSSPYFNGCCLASSSRAAIYRYRAHSTLARYRDLWDYVENVEEWEERIEEQYEVLRLIAREHGIDEAVFERTFHPENAVLTPVRLRKRSPTVEWRAPDTALPSQILRLATDVSTLVRKTQHKDVVIGEPGVRPDEIGVPPFPEVRELSTAAINEGVRSPQVRQYLETMGFDVGTYRPISDRIERRWTLPAERARSLRLEYAALLRTDVERLNTMTRSFR